MLMHQTDTIIWIPISEKLPPSGFVLASTKIDVHILQYSKGPTQMAHRNFGWTDQKRSWTSDLKTLSLGQSCLDLFAPLTNRPKCLTLQLSEPYVRHHGRLQYQFAAEPVVPMAPAADLQTSPCAASSKRASHA